MPSLFTIQIITSFLVGGGLVALLSFLAERASGKVAGIILAIPSNTALGYFFLSWATSEQAVVQNIPAALIPLGVSVLYCAIYLFIAEKIAARTSSKIVQISLSFLLSTVVWLTVAIGIAILKINNLLITVPIYLALTLLTHILLNQKHHQKAPALTYTTAQKLGRAAFAGTIVTLVVFLGKTLGAIWGNVFAMFPAVFSSSLMIFHWYYQPESLLAIMKKVPIGSLSIFAYVITVMLTFEQLGFIWGTVAAYVVSLLVTLGLSKIQRSQ